MRSAGGRRAATSRVYSRKPVTLPMEHLLAARRDGQHGFPRQNALVFAGEDLDELGEHLLPAFEDPFGARALSDFDVLRNQTVEQGDIEARRSEEHTSELQSLRHLVCRLL